MTKSSMTMAAVIAMTGVASADAPTMPEVKATVTKLVSATIHADGALDEARISPLLATPFRYAGFQYTSADPEVDKMCKKKFRSAGTVKEQDLPMFADCLADTMWGGPTDPGAEWSVVDVKKLPKDLRKHKATFAKLAKDHVLVSAHFIPDGPAEYWNIYAAKKVDGKVVLGGLVTVNILGD